MDGGGVADSGEAVGDDDGSAALHEAVEGLLDCFVRTRCRGRRWLRPGGGWGRF